MHAAPGPKAKHRTVRCNILQGAGSYQQLLTITNCRFLPFRVLHHREAMTGWI